MPTEKWTLTKKDIHTITVGNKPTEPAAVVDQDDPTTLTPVTKKPTTITPAMKAIEKKVLADMRREEAGRVLSWLNENGCLHFGALTKALAAIERGDHRR